MDKLAVPIEIARDFFDHVGHAIQNRLATAGEFFAPYWTSELILKLVIGYSIGYYLWKNFLRFRQYRVYRKYDTPPSEVCNLLDNENFIKSRNYKLESTQFSFITGVVHEILNLSILYFNGYFIFWSLAGSVQSYFGIDEDNEYVRSNLFILVSLFLSIVISLPFELYSTFVIEQKHGFNKQTIGFFFFDKLKQMIVLLVILIPVLCGIIKILKIGGDAVFFYLWAFVSILSILLATIYPSLIAPLFDKYYPLPEGYLKEEIEKLAASLKFPLTKIFVVENSKRNSHSNAYFYGLFNKRIVLYDTLVKNLNPVEEPANNTDENSTDAVVEKKGCTDEEVLAVLCHELGHWKHNHTTINIGIGLTNSLFTFLIAGSLYQNEALLRAFGFENEKPLLIGLFIAMSHVFAPYDLIFSFFSTCLSRRFEFQADEFAKKMHKASYLRQALITLNKDNLSFPIYDWLYSAWHLSHPPIQERLEALGKID